tara:strand:+ start:149 stop:274 length:126 start_codon:yes stop_codon:yes gene_type:complete
MSRFGDLISGKKAEPVVETKSVESKPIETVKKTTSENKLKI